MPRLLQIIIVGGGISGLAASIGLRRKGHKVTVLERHQGCQTLGGPIYLGPSATRVLIEYGLKDRVEQKNILNQETIVYRRYSNGNVLLTQDPPNASKVYGYPLWGSTRFHIQETLAEFAVELGVEIIFGAQVKNIDQSPPALVLNDGRKFDADLIIGADGINSIIRRTILNDKVVTPGRAGCAFNIDLPRSFLRKHPEMLEFLNGSNFWYGPGRWVLAGNMPQHGDRLNLCLSSNKIGGMEGEWYQRGDLNSVKEEFKDFDPRIMKLLDGTDPSDCYIWRISDISPLPTWVSDSGKLVIIGDSAHAMVPSGGMGAGTGIEDGACLAECLDRLDSLHDLPRILKAYQMIRKPRAEYMVMKAREFLSVQELPDGEAQETRDAHWSRQGHPGTAPQHGAHIDDPPETFMSAIAEKYVRGYNVFDYTNRQLNKI